MTGPSSQDLECVEVVIAAESAERLADFTRQLVGDRLVACGQNIVPIRATYRWVGKVYDETQARVGLHTRASSGPTIVARADRDHPDDVPASSPYLSLTATLATSLGWWRDQRARIRPPRAPQMTQLEGVRDAVSEVRGP